MSESVAASKTDATTTAPAATEGASAPVDTSATTVSQSAAGDTGSSELPASLYVGDLSPVVTEAVLFEIFSRIGPLSTIRVCRDAVTHESLGYAYVNYQKHEDAAKALQELNYTTIRGRPCRIMWCQHDPTMRKSGKGNVFVKNLDPSINIKTLHDIFSTFGEILSCKIGTDSNGNQLGFAFVHFATAEAAELAIETANGMEVQDRPLHVTHHLQRYEREARVEAMRAQFTNVYVKNLPPSFTEEKLNEMFGKFGKITSTFLAVDEQGQSKGFGLVNFEKHESAQNAVDELNDSVVEGMKLYVSRAQNKFERQNELKKKFEQRRLEQLTKSQGVNLYVKNLDNTIDSQKLHEMFEPFGTITSARVMTHDGKSRGFGFVCYSNPEEAQKAISEMNQHMVGNRPLYVTLAQRKDVRSNQMRQQLQAQNQMRMQQQQAVNGLQYVSPFVYPGQAPMVNGVRLPMAQAGMMVSPPGIPPVAGWQQPVAAVPPQENVDKVTALERSIGEYNPSQQKQLIGELLYLEILEQDEMDEALAGRITGMLLDMENAELFAILKDKAQLKEQVAEALKTYRDYEAQNSGKSQ